MTDRKIVDLTAMLLGEIEGEYRAAHYEHVAHLLEDYTYEGGELERMNRELRMLRVYLMILTRIIVKAGLLTEEQLVEALEIVAIS